MFPSTLFFRILIAGIVSAGLLSCKSSGANYLAMKVNGDWWKADRDIFGSWHYTDKNELVISGYKGPGGKNEQAFTIDLNQTSGPASYTIGPGSPDHNLAQLSNYWSEGLMYVTSAGGHLHVTITRCSQSPQMVEGHFEGTIGDYAGHTVSISDGRFHYSE